MLWFDSPEGVHVKPSWLKYTPRSVPAATRFRAKANTRTLRPSSPAAADHETPPSLLASAPPPRVPARTSWAGYVTSWAGYGLKLMVVSVEVPACSGVRRVPPLALGSSEPAELPATRTWLFEGSTASAKIGVRP